MTQPPASRPDAAPDTDFLPNLCQSQTVFMLVLVAELIALLLTVAQEGLRHFSWDLLAITSFYVQWIVLLCALALCRLRPLLRRWSWVKAGIASYLIVLLITLLLSLLGQWLLHLLFDHRAPSRPFQADYWQLLDNLLIAAILAGIFLRYLYLQHQLRIQQQVELHARIQALQSRIRPHFLFNSMNSIASLIGVDPVAAERVVEDLAELFRASLAEPSLIPLERELALCRHYLDIEKLRLGDRLQLAWQLEPLPEDVEIPSLLLQPLLENAVFHGIEPLPNGGKISIGASVKNGQLTLKITNPLVVSAPHPRQVPGEKNNRHNHMARDNIRRRLQAHYGDAARFSTAVDRDTFTTLISYPITAKKG